MEDAHTKHMIVVSELLIHCQCLENYLGVWYYLRIFCISKVQSSVIVQIHSNDYYSNNETIIRAMLQLIHES